MQSRKLQRLATILAAVALASACGKAEEAEDSPKKTDSLVIGTPMAAPTAAPAPAFSDANVLAKLDADNAADSSAGAMAVARGTSASVKEFGRMMMKDHHAMRVEGAALASKAAIMPAMPPGDRDAAAAAVADSMAALPKGAAWDKFFADHQVDGHTKVLKFAQDAANGTRNADLRAMIQRAAPTVEKHLVKAKAIQGALGSATAGAPM